MSTDGQAAAIVGDPYDEAAYKKLDKLQEKFLAAKKDKAKNPEAFKKARDAYQSLRTEIRQAEEADPQHRRGTVLAAVQNEG